MVYLQEITVHSTHIHKNKTLFLPLTPYSIIRTSRCKNNLQTGKSGSWFLYHNAPTHSAVSVCEFLAKKMVVVPHAPYSPDLEPCDSFLFPNLKMVLKEKKFNYIIIRQAESHNALAEFQTTDFTKCFPQWYDHLSHLMKSHGY
jgi:histone-lysine N-methyltransferase SETMAR